MPATLSNSCLENKYFRRRDNKEEKKAKGREMTANSSICSKVAIFLHNGTTKHSPNGIKTKGGACRLNGSKHQLALVAELAKEIKFTTKSRRKIKKKIQRRGIKKQKEAASLNSGIDLSVWLEALRLLVL